MFWLDELTCEQLKIQLLNLQKKFFRTIRGSFHNKFDVIAFGDKQLNMQKPEQKKTNK